MNKPCNFLILALLVGALILTGCGPKNTGGGLNTPTTPPQVPTTVAPNAVARTIRLDPATVEDADSLAVSSYVYDSLTVLDANGDPQPALAVQWTASDDQLDYVVSLRQEAAFSSSAPFNADAVLANFNRWFDPADPLHGSATYTGWANLFLGFKGEVDANGVPKSPFDGIEKVDESTVLIHLNRPEPNLFTNLAQPYFAILDPALLASEGTAYGTSADSVGGTGAYSVSSWTDAGLVLTPNAGYWGGAPTGDLQIGWK